MAFKPRAKGLPLAARASLWPKTQVRLPPDLASLLEAYSALVGLQRTQVIRAVLRHAMTEAFGTGRTATEVKQALSQLDLTSRQSYAIGIRQAFERLCS